MLYLLEEIEERRQARFQRQKLGDDVPVEHVVSGLKRDFIMVIAKERTDGRKFRCPICQYKTLDSRGCSDICLVCRWDDDGFAEYYPDEISSPNRITPNEGIENYLSLGSAQERLLKYVRPPLPQEL